MTVGTAPVEASAPRLVLSNVSHPPVCGQRVRCPSCGLVNGDYKPAEKWTRDGLTFVLCHACRRSWRLV